MGLHVRGQSGRGVVASGAGGALVRFLRVVRLHVDLQVIAGMGFKGLLMVFCEVKGCVGVDCRSCVR